MSSVEAPLASAASIVAAVEGALIIILVAVLVRTLRRYRRALENQDAPQIEAVYADSLRKLEDEMGPSHIAYVIGRELAKVMAHVATDESTDTASIYTGTATASSDAASSSPDTTSATSDAASSSPDTTSATSDAASSSPDASSSSNTWSDLDDLPASDAPSASSDLSATDAVSGSDASSETN